MREQERAPGCLLPVRWKRTEEEIIVRNPRRIATFLGLTLAVTAVFLAGCQAQGAVSETVERTLALGEGGSFSIENINGPIAIAVGASDEISLRATKTARDADGLKSITVDINEGPGCVAISTRFSKLGVFGSWMGRATSVAYDLQVPRDAAVRAKSVNGTITISDIAGDLQTETVNGAVRISDVAGQVTAKTVNGSLKASYAAVNDSGMNSFKTVNGSVEVRLPPAVSGQFRAKTVNGSLKSDFPLDVRKPKYGPGRSIEDRLGASDATYSFSTVNGSIRILEK